MSLAFYRQGRQRGDRCLWLQDHRGTSASGSRHPHYIYLQSNLAAPFTATPLRGQTHRRVTGKRFTCWVPRGGSGPSDSHTLPSSPAAAPASARASQQPRAAFCEARKTRLERPARSLGFRESRGRQSDFFRTLQSGKAL